MADSDSIAEDLPIPAHVNLKLDLVTRRGIADFMSRMQIANRSDAIRALIAAGLGANANPEGSPQLELARAAYRNAVMRGLAAVKASLPVLLESVVEKLSGEEV